MLSVRSSFPTICSLASLLLLTQLPLAQAQTLESITVTGTRTPTELKQLGGNISVVSEDELRLIAATHINESLARVPGTWISRGNGQEHLTAIRSPVLTGAGACGAFLMAEDGLALRASGFCNLNQLFEVNSEQARRIEVVRGPASAFYGSNAVHGVINVLSFEAPEETHSRLGAEFGPDDYYRLQAHQAFDKGLHGLRVYGNATSDGGYKDDSGFDQQKINISHYYSGDQLSIKNHLSLSNLNQETAGFVSGRDAYKDEDLKRSNPNPEAFRDAQSARLYSRINLQLDNGSELTLRPFFRYSDMAFLQHFLPWQPVEENGVKSLGAQAMLAGSSGDLRWNAGLDVEYNDGYLTEIQAEPFSPAQPAGVHYDYDVESNSLSPFASVAWSVSEKTTINAALRFDRTEYDYTNNTVSPSACAVTVTNCRFARPDSRSDTFEDWSPSLSVTHAISDNNMAYVSVSRGFRAPQATELYRLQAGQLLTDLDSERLDSIELGIRGELANLSYDAAIYRMNKEDFIFQDTDRQNISGGESEHTGLEVSIVARLTDRVTASINGTVAKHEYSNDVQISRVSINGNDIDTAPKHSGNMRLAWQANDKLNTELEWVRLGAYYQNPENTAKYPGHDLLNLRASYSMNESWQFGVRLINALDTEYAERADFGFGSDRYFVGQPRSVYFSVNTRF